MESSPDATAATLRRLIRTATEIAERIRDCVGANWWTLVEQLTVQLENDYRELPGQSQLSMPDALPPFRVLTITENDGTSEIDYMSSPRFVGLIQPAERFKDGGYVTMLLCSYPNGLPAKVHRHLAVNFTGQQEINAGDGAEEIAVLKAWLRHWRSELEVEELPTVISSSPLVQSLMRCRQRLQSVSEQHRTVAAMLVHHSEVGKRPECPLPENFEPQAHHMLCNFAGPRQDKRQLFNDDGTPKVGDKPYCDVDGSPMVYSDGSPIAFYAGARRIIYFWGREFRNSSPDDYCDSIAALQTVGEELGVLLVDLPMTVKEIVWVEWKCGYQYSVGSQKGIWFDAVYELAFQHRPASGLAAKRNVWGENVKLGLMELSEFRERPGEFGGLFNELIEHVGNPPAYWYSWIEDIASASIAAIDLLLSLLEERAETLIAVADAATLTTAATSGEASGSNNEVHVAGLATLTNSQRKAWATWKLAENAQAETPTDQQAYNWLQEHQEDVFIGELSGYSMPAADTWKRYVREARKVAGENKNEPRAGRGLGGSVVNAQEL